MGRATKPSSNSIAFSGDVSPIWTLSSQHPLAQTLGSPDYIRDKVSQLSVPPNAWLYQFNHSA